MQAEKHPLQFLFENVASMDPADRDVVSHYLGVRPVVACASDISQARRRQYYWASWRFMPAPGVEIEERAETWSATFTAEIPDSQLWVTKGWEMAGSPDVRLPTFMRALPKRKEIYLPSGISLTPAQARGRWKAHKWRYPPYHYKTEFCLRKRRQPRLLRVLNADKRETVMFLGRGATLYALNPTKAKLDPQLLEDERCILVGNSFHAGVVALIFAGLAEQRKLLKSRPSPQDIVDRMGLRPGEIFVDGLVCGLDRPPTFHRLDGRRRGHLFPSFDKARAARSKESTDSLELLTLSALLRGADYRGADIRMDAGELTKPSRWPRRSIDPTKWCWYV